MRVMPQSFSHPCIVAKNTSGVLSLWGDTDSGIDQAKENGKELSEVESMLKTETDTPAMEKRVLRDAYTVLGKRNLRAYFEHGQWWITHTPSGAQWAVNDTLIGLFDFEQVSPGEDE